MVRTPTTNFLFHSLDNGIVSPSEKSKNRYFNVSLCKWRVMSSSPSPSQANQKLTRKKVSILSSCCTGTSSTLTIVAYPPPGIRQCFSIAWNISQP